MSEINKSNAASSSLLFIAFLAVLFQFLSRYAAAPVADFSSDAWGLLQRAESEPSFPAIWRLILQEPDRPLQAGVLIATFRLFGDCPWLYAVQGMVVYSLYMLVAVALTWKLTGDRRAALVFGLVFALLPNLSESFQWAAMTTVAYMQVAYVASAWCWVHFVRRGGATVLIASVFFYAIAVTSYEWGFALPLVLGILALRPGSYRRLWGLLPFGLVAALYLTWRLTKGFGMAQGVLFPPRELEASADAVVWNASEVIRWWIGSHMLDCLRNGLHSFATMSKWPQRLFAVTDFAVVLALGAYVVGFFRREAPHPEGSPPPFASWQLAAFSIAWVITGHAPSLVSWTAARMNFYPAFGVALLCSITLARIDARKWVGAFCVSAFVLLLANQGTAVSWKDAGVFQRRLYEYLQAHEEDWSQKEAVLFDTTQLRQRQTLGILPPADNEPHTWAYYGNASLLRGFVPAAMIRLVRTSEPRPKTALDMECGARIESGELIWHERYDPGRPLKTSVEKVYVVDCFSVGSGQTR